MTTMQAMTIKSAVPVPARRRAAAFAVAGLSVLLLLGGCNKKDYTAYALTDTSKIISFATNKPTKILNNVDVNGLSTDQSLVQLAYRPSNGVLYGVTSDNFLCQVDPLTGIVSSCTTMRFIENRLSNVAASFDPVNDVLRVTASASDSPSGRVNLRVSADNGAQLPPTANPNLDYSDDTNGSPQINALAYDNPLVGATSTTLYGLDVNSLTLVRIGDKDVGGSDGSVNDGGVDSIGSPGVSFNSNVGLVIAPQDGTAYAVLGTGGASLYTIDLDNGTATLVDAVNDTDYALISLVIAPNS